MPDCAIAFEEPVLGAVKTLEELASAIASIATLQLFHSIDKRFAAIERCVSSRNRAFRKGYQFSGTGEGGE